MRRFYDKTVHHPLNQYTQRTVPGNVQVRGEAAPDAVVTVNENPAWRSGEYFYGGDYADNSALPVFKELEIAAVVPSATPDGWDEMSAVTGRVFVAQTPEQFTYDADGNMLTDGRFRYTWNAENRLVRAQELVAPTNRNPYTVSYAYDHKGRMVSKRITENDGHDTLVKSISYLWDGWNIIREIQGSGVRDQGSGATLVTDNVWGLDLDGTLQGAGGVGGLLAVLRSDCAVTNSQFSILNSQFYLPTYDANGNVSEYVSTNGEVVAHYDYSPFGEILIESGDLASSFTHRFSTKPWCPVTGLCEYQMRKYRPEIGRWLSRDPMEEERINIPQSYVFVENNVTRVIDYLGKEVFVIDQLPGVSPPGGWPNTKDQAVVDGAYIRSLNITPVPLGQSLYKLKTSFIPPNTLLFIYYRKENNPFIKMQEMEHVQCHKRCYEDAIDKLFIKYNDKIVCENEISSVAKDVDDVISDALAREAVCHEYLDKTGGPHGH